LVVSGMERRGIPEVTNGFGNSVLLHSRNNIEYYAPHTTSFPLLLQDQ
jgi:hypothetical protein